MASSITFHESYGDVSRAQLAAYRKHNVSPSDHDGLIMRFDSGNHEAITAYVKQNAATHNGQYSAFDLWLGR